MGRRSGFEGFLRASVRAAAAIDRENKRSLRSHAAEARRVERQNRQEYAQYVREEKQLIREQKEADKLAKVMYLEDRIEEVNDLNSDLVETIAELSGILEHTLNHDDSIDFSSLKMVPSFKKFQTPSHLLPDSSPIIDFVPMPMGWRKLIPGAGKKYNSKVELAEKKLEVEMKEYISKEKEKSQKIEEMKNEYSRGKNRYLDEVNRHNEDIDEFEISYFSGDELSVKNYCEMVLTRSEYPQDGFQQNFRLAYTIANKELVIEYFIPSIDVIPKDLEYKYIKTRDAITSKLRKPSEINKLYQDIIAAIALRTLHEIFEADQAGAILSVVFNGVLDTVDPTSGHDINVNVVSVRAFKEEFMAIKLDRIDKVACLRSLGAQVSNHPEELQAIKPIIEFNMVDKRFIEQGDALSGLESRPNLMDLSPGEFEILVSNLFSQMGLDTKLTRGTKDGGVDAIAFDTRPILGGKVVIQAKRYKDTVGVSAVRDLYGTMMNEGANKGILVCTSKYGKDAYNFCKDKPIELIDGGGLIYLLREHAGVDAKIQLL